MGSIFLYGYPRQVSINKMKTLVSTIFFASIFNWIEGAPFLKLSSHDAILLIASHSGDICKNLELQESEHHLLTDPDDCKKFFSCQYSRSGWLAYRMSCADGSHFDGVYCVTGDSCLGINLVKKEDPKLSETKYYTTTPKSSSTSTATEIPTNITKREIPTTTITTEIPTTIITEIPTTTTTPEIPSTTTTTSEPTTTITTDEPTTTITTDDQTTTITTEMPTTKIITEIPTTTTETTTTTTTTKIATSIKITEEPTTETQSFVTTTEIEGRTSTTSSSSTSITTSKEVTPRKFLPDETDGEFLPDQSSVDYSTAETESFGEFQTEDTTEHDMGSGEMW